MSALERTRKGNECFAFQLIYIYLSSYYGYQTTETNLLSSWSKGERGYRPQLTQIIQEYCEKTSYIVHYGEWIITDDSWRSKGALVLQRRSKALSTQAKGDRVGWVIVRISSLWRDVKHHLELRRHLIQHNGGLLRERCWGNHWHWLHGMMHHHWPARWHHRGMGIGGEWEGERSGCYHRWLLGLLLELWQILWEIQSSNGIDRSIGSGIISGRRRVGYDSNVASIVGHLHRHSRSIFVLSGEEEIAGGNR